MTTALAPVPTAANPETRSVCQHQPPCPPADANNREAARALARHPEQGWSLLCNGVVCFDDGGVLLADGTRVAPPSSTPALHRRTR